MPAVLLGLDVGTSGVRAALFDENGCEIPRASAANSQKASTGSGLSQLDAEEVVQLVAHTIDDLFATPGIVNTKIELISISCFWHSLLGVDGSGRASTPIYTWADTRSLSAVNGLRARFDEKEVHARTGCRFHPSYWPAKLWWLRQERPNAFKSSSLWLGFGEYLAYRLCGATSASISMASATGFFNQRSCEWDREFIDQLDLPFQKFPDLIPSNQYVGQLRKKYGMRWPALSDARVYPAIGDGAANNIGSGCLSKEKAALMVGTSGAMRTLYEDDPPTQLPDSLWCYRADSRRVVTGGALSDGGGLYRWLVDSLAFAAESESLEDKVAQLEPDGHGLTVLPFWSGERSTGWVADARGAILGLTMQTQPTHILRAAMEAVAYRFALILRALETLTPGSTIFASGNALQNSWLWVQIIADVLNRPISLTGKLEASNRGAALLVLEAAGKIERIEEFPVPVERVFEPDTSRHARYREALERQERFYGLLVEGKDSRT